MKIKLVGYKVAKMTIETQLMTIESANVNQETFNAMRAGAEAVRNIHRNVTVEEVDKMQDEMREQMEIANEISEAISQPVGFGADIDEDELLDELERLEQDAIDNRMLEMETPDLVVPRVPVVEPTRVAAPPRRIPLEDEDAELQQLKESMEM